MSVYNTVLAIDASLNGCSVAVQSFSVVISVCDPMYGGQAERLMPMIEDGIAQAGAEYKDIEAVITTLGPGAFTGVRISLSVAKALGLSLNIPVFGISTLQVLALAYAQQHENNSISVIIETKRSDFYIQRFDKHYKSLSAPQALGLEQAINIISQDDVLIGDGVARFMRESGKSFQSDYAYNLTDMRYALAAFADLKRSQEYFTQQLEPLYLRGPDVSYPKPGQRVLAD